MAHITPYAHITLPYRRVSGWRFTGVYNIGGLYLLVSAPMWQPSRDLTRRQCGGRWEGQNESEAAGVRDHVTPSVMRSRRTPPSGDICRRVGRWGGAL